MKYQGTIKIRLKTSILDPHAAATMNLLKAQNHDYVESLLIGKFMEITLEASSKEEATELIHQLCRNLLINPVMEEYDLKVTEA